MDSSYHMFCGLVRHKLTGMQLFGAADPYWIRVLEGNLPGGYDSDGKSTWIFLGLLEASIYWGLLRTSLDLEQLGDALKAGCNDDFVVVYVLLGFLFRVGCKVIGSQGGGGERERGGGLGVWGAQSPRCRGFEGQQPLGTKNKQQTFQTQIQNDHNSRSKLFPKTSIWENTSQYRTNGFLSLKRCHYIKKNVSFEGPRGLPHERPCPCICIPFMCP